MRRRSVTQCRRTGRTQRIIQSVREHAVECCIISSMDRSRTKARNASQDRRVEWSEKAARDRLSSTVFLAALFHGVVILGVSFSAGDDPELPAADLAGCRARGKRARAARGRRRQPCTGRAIAARRGQHRGDQIACKPPSPAARNLPRSGRTAPVQSDPWKPERFPAIDRYWWHHAASSAGETRNPARQIRHRCSSRLPSRTTRRFIEIVNEPETRTLISDAGPRELVISANTRESRIAGYLSTWKQQVERVGTLNFPRQTGSRGLSGHPTLEVAIRADGTLQEVVVRSSSGERLIDDAAVEILRIAAPFDPFPEFLRTDYDVLRFAYEWRFGAEPGIARVSAAGGS